MLKKSTSLHNSNNLELPSGHEMSSQTSVKTPGQASRRCREVKIFLDVLFKLLVRRQSADVAEDVRTDDVE